MLFDGPACFRLDRIPVRPIHWLWSVVSPLAMRGPSHSFYKGYTRCAMLSRPPFHAFLPSGSPRKHVGLAGSHAFAG